jgi:hypothetical protein
VTGATLGGSLTTAAQPNITSVGTLTALAVTGNLSAGNITTGTIAQARLANSTVTVNGTVLTLGGTSTITANTTQTLTRGTYLTGVDFNGGTAATWAVDAVAAATADKVVVRDTNGSFAANVVTAQDFDSLSDARLKIEVQPIVDPLAVLQQIEGVEFKWLNSGKLSSGVIAQQLELVLPYLVDTKSDGFKAVNYSGLTAFLIESVKVLAERVDYLENQMKKDQ